MRLFISFAQADKELAARLEAALRRHNIQTWSRLDASSGEEWKRMVDQEGRSADGFIFLLGPGFSANTQLQAEWRSFLRSDWDSKKALVPLIAAYQGSSSDLPPFLRNRKAIYTTNFDTVIGELKDLVEHPIEALDRKEAERARAEQRERLTELTEHALALKEQQPEGETKT